MYKEAKKIKFRILALFVVVLFLGILPVKEAFATTMTEPVLKKINQQNESLDSYGSIDVSFTTVTSMPWKYRRYNFTITVENTSDKIMTAKYYLPYWYSMTTVQSDDIASGLPYKWNSEEAVFYSPSEVNGNATVPGRLYVNDTPPDPAIAQLSYPTRASTGFSELIKDSNSIVGATGDFRQEPYVVRGIAEHTGDDTLIQIDFGELQPGEIKSTTYEMKNYSIAQDLHAGIIGSAYIDYVSYTLIDHTEIATHDQTIYLGQSLSAQDLFVSAVDVLGNAIIFAELDAVDFSQVNLSAAGVYPVTYQEGDVVKTAYLTILLPEVNVHYIDESGVELASEQLGGPIGTSYAASEKKFDGYEVKEIQGSTTGVFTEQPQEITYIYQRSMGGKVTVFYQDEQGKDLLPADVLSGLYGDSYVTSAQEVTGYELVTAPANATGSFNGETQSVTYIYRKKAEPEVVKLPSKPTSPAEKLPETKGNNENSTKESSKTTLSLPNTGENADDSMIFKIIGFILVVGGIVFMGNRSRQNS